MILSEYYTLNIGSLSVISATEWGLQTFTYWRGGGGVLWYREYVIGNLSLVPKSASVFLPLWSPQVSQLRETEEVLERMKLCRTGQWIFEGVRQNLVRLRSACNGMDLHHFEALLWINVKAKRLKMTHKMYKNKHLWNRDKEKKISEVTRSRYAYTDLLCNYAYLGRLFSITNLMYNSFIL